MESTTKRLVLDETVIMCPGTCCAMRSQCYRYRLDRFFDTIAKTPHHNPKWVTPAYSKEYRNCPFFRKTEYIF